MLAAEKNDLRSILTPNNTRLDFGPFANQFNLPLGASPTGKSANANRPLHPMAPIKRQCKSIVNTRQKPLKTLIRPEEWRRKKGPSR
jgi:hypothetical protein